MNGRQEETARVTVGITCYNAKDTIAQAIASAGAQTWPNLEILVVDDASNDSSADVAQAALDRIQDGRLIRHRTNGGVAAARNTLLAEATGRYIAFFDDDDVSAPERIAIQVTRLEAEKANADAVICFASGERLYPNGYRLRADAIGSSARVPSSDEIVSYLLLNRRVPDVFYGAGVPSCALMAPVAVLRAAGGYDEALKRVEDVDIAIRLALAGTRFVGCPEYLYRQHATLGSDKTPARNLVGELAIVEKHRVWLEAHGLYRHARAWFQFREAWFSRRRGEAVHRAAALFLSHPNLTLRRLVQAAPKRLVHEWRMARPKAGTA